MNAADFPDIFEPFEKLVEIEIKGKKQLVPENNSLLRCFQFLALETISGGNFCWNGDCLNCQIVAEIGGREKTLIACRAKVSEGMKIISLSDEIKML